MLLAMNALSRPRHLLAPLGLGAAAMFLLACSKDWDSYDPRLGEATSTSSAGSAQSSAASGAPTGATSSTSSGSGGAASSSSSSSSTASGGAGGGGPDCLIALSDTFDGVLDGTKWGTEEDAGGDVQQAGGEIVATLPPTTIAGTTYAAIFSLARFDMSNCGAFVRVTVTPDSSTLAYAHLLARLDQYNFIELVKQGPNLLFRKWIAGQLKELLSVPYDAAAQRYWKIRGVNGSLFWETSPDAKTWKIEAQQPFTGADSFELTNLQVWIAAGAFQPETNPGGAHFDDLNIAPP